MPSAPSKYKAPRASRKKRMNHTFHLLQPFFQFFALLLVVLAFVRCSPLAPSTDKSPVGVIGGGGGGGLSGGGSGLSALAIQQSLQELSSKDAKVISETDFRKITEDVKSAEDSLDESQAKTLFQRQHAHTLLNAQQKMFFLTLSPENVSTLVRDGKVQVDMSQRLSRASDQGRTFLFSGFQHEAQAGALDASGFLVMPDGSMSGAQKEYGDISLPLKISFGSPTNGKAFLVVETTPSANAADQTNAALLEDALRQGPSLAVVLE